MFKAILANRDIFWSRTTGPSSEGIAEDDGWAGLEMA
jgi:hypothetical protein